MIQKAKTPLGGERGFLTGEAGWGSQRFNRWTRKRWKGSNKAANILLAED
jgi:hypothetical protein